MGHLLKRLAVNWRQIGVGVDADKRRQKGDALKLAKYYFLDLRPSSVLESLFPTDLKFKKPHLFIQIFFFATFSLQNLNYDHFCNIFVAIDPKIHSSFAKMHRSLAEFRDYCPCPRETNKLVLNRNIDKQDAVPLPLSCLSIFYFDSRKNRTRLR